MKGRSTTTNLLQFTSICLKAIESHKQVDCIYTDFSKAFDKISHNLLLFKLEAYGYPSLFIGWIKSYLSERSQQVLFRGAVSESIANTSGVPQGSHLGPLLFIIYINDVSLVVFYSEILIFADDVKLFRIICDVLDCNLLWSDFKSFCEWCSKNYMFLNLDKCSIVSYNRKKVCMTFGYSMNEHSLPRFNTIKDLGVKFDAQLCFNTHIGEVSSRANSMLGFIKRWSKEFDCPFITRLLYCCYVRPVLEYACVVWNPYYDVHINRIESVQRRFLIFALRGQNRFDLPSYEQRLNLIRLETLEKRRKSTEVCMVFKVLNGEVDDCVLLEQLSISIPARSLRNPSFLVLKNHRTNYGHCEPVTRISRAFNDNYDKVDFGLSVLQLKNRLKSFNFDSVI